MRSSFINPPRRRRRGTAEVETVLVIPILLTILMLCGILVKLGVARVTNSRDAEQNAYRQVVRGVNPVAATDVTPAPAPDTMRLYPPLARYDQASPTTQPKMTQNALKLDGITIKDRAVFLDPPFHLANWPADLTVSDDPKDLERWYSQYIDEVHPWEWRYYLGLEMLDRPIPWKEKERPFPGGNGLW